MMDAVKLTLVGAGMLVAGGVAIALGLLPVSDALAIGERVWPVLLFVTAITVVAELAAVAGVFDVVASRLARLSRGRTWLLWLAIVVLAVVATAFLSLDTTAVLLTPVVVVVARSHGLSPLPFAFATVWLANTASLFLPVSNLTNLLAVHRLGSASPAEFIGLLGPSALLAVIVPVLLLAVVHRRELRGTFVPAAPPAVADRLQLRVAATVVLVVMPLLVSGIEPWIPASAAALVLAGFFAWRSPAALRPGLVPGPLLVFASGLFLLVGAVEAVGSRALLAALAAGGAGPGDLWGFAGAGLLLANAVNNLPAYLALEAAATTPERLAALLIGVNAGPLITPWASLATLLWHQRLHTLGVSVPWRRYVLLGLVAAPATVAAAILPLALRA